PNALQGPWQRVGGHLESFHCYWCPFPVALNGPWPGRAGPQGQGLALQDRLAIGPFSWQRVSEGNGMARGTIAKVVRDRGFGFIRGNDGKEVFFHRSGLIGMNFDDLEQGTM